MPPERRGFMILLTAARMAITGRTRKQTSVISWNLHHHPLHGLTAFGESTISANPHETALRSIPYSICAFCSQAGSGPAGGQHARGRRRLLGPVLPRRGRPPGPRLGGSRFRVVKDPTPPLPSCQGSESPAPESSRIPGRRFRVINSRFIQNPSQPLPSLQVSLDGSCVDSDRAGPEAIRRCLRPHPAATSQAGR